MMIQPTLDAYILFQQPSPVFLSATSIASDRILLLDTFFHVVVWYGNQIADWRNKGFAEQPEYAHLKALLEAPKAYIEVCL
jgi:protein transport protein SEC23